MWEDYGMSWPVTVKVIDGVLQITYQSQNESGCQELITNFVTLGWTDNPLGIRMWFACPGCNRNVADLYLVDKYCLCRHCYNLGYASQRNIKIDDSF